MNTVNRKKYFLGIAFSCALLLVLSLGSGPAAAQQSEAQEKEALPTLDELLQLIRQGQLAENRENLRREQRFRAQRNRQDRLLAEAREERDREERRSDELEAIFESNQELIAIKRLQLQDTLGSLVELFGHMSAAAGDLRSDLETSVISAQYRGRVEFLDELISKISESDALPEVREVERLWYELQREINEAGKVVSFPVEVISLDGNRETRQVVRVGAFNIIDDRGRYLNYVGEKKHLEELARQPGGAFNRWAKGLARANGEEGLQIFAIDPTGPAGGAFLASLIDAPTLVERWHQGRIIGYLISALGVFALALALLRLGILSLVGRQVSQQLRQVNTLGDNPLGRVLKVYEANPGLDLESLELKMSEAILHERPALERGEALLRIIAAVAPLMGLLGTVTGMILVFQGIVIFGAGDPKAMAGGISQALVTTVLGLIVAIPTLLLYTLVNTRSQGIIQVLEEQATGIVARRSEVQQG